MKTSQFIEKNFWIFLIAGIVAGLWQPLAIHAPVYLPKLLLGMMLFFVFLKIDVRMVFERMKDYKLMIFLAFIYMILVPILFFLTVSIFDRQVALGILLLAAMPAGVSTPALTDILKGNIPLSMSIAIFTQIIAPFTVPLLFWIIGTRGLEINELLLFRDIAAMIFIPLIAAQGIKRYFTGTVKRNQHLFTSVNVLLLFAFVYVAISSQRDIILRNPVNLIWKTVVLYLVFIVLHVIGFFIRSRDTRENRIALAVTAAYMNNGLAIVLASAYFGPDILVLMVLSEIPWNTLPSPFKRIIRQV